LTNSGLPGQVIAAAFLFVANDGMDATGDVLGWLQTKPDNQTVTRCYSWKIDNLDPVDLRSDPDVLDGMASPPFSALGMVWSLRLSIVEAEGGAAMLGAFLCLKEPKFRHKVTFNIVLVNQRDAALSIIENSPKPDTPCDWDTGNRGWDMISLDKLLAKDEGFLVNGSLMFTVAICEESIDRD